MRSKRRSDIWTPGGVSRTLRPSTLTVKPMVGLQRACETTMSTMAADSVEGRFWKERRAGILANKLQTSMTVPGAIPAGSNGFFAPSSTPIRMPSEFSVRLATLRRLTMPMLANASPRNPSVCMALRSLAVASLLVACRVTANSSSSAGIPPPSSMTEIRSKPPRSISTRIRDAPASMLFSTNSLTT